jgi:hypothetical protein
MQYTARTLWTNVNKTKVLRLLDNDSVCYLPTNAHKCIEISLYTQWPRTCFGQPCGLLQGAKIQRLYILKV